MRIVGDNIILRTVESEDIDLLFRWENDPQTQAFNAEHTTFSMEDIEQFINGIHDIYLEKQLRLMIVQETSKEAIGTLDLFHYDDEDKSIGIGILIFKEENRRKGLASGAMDLAIRYSSKHLNIKKIFCNIDPSNKISVKFFKTKGFRKESRNNILSYFESKRLAEMDFYLLDLHD